MTTRRTAQTPSLAGSVRLLAALALVAALALAAPAIAGGKGGKGGGGGSFVSPAQGGGSGSSGKTSSRASSSDGGSKKGSGSSDSSVKSGGGGHSASHSGGSSGGSLGGWQSPRGSGGSSSPTHYEPPTFTHSAPKASTPHTTGSPSSWGGSWSAPKPADPPHYSGSPSRNSGSYSGGTSWRAPYDSGGKGTGRTPNWSRPDPGSKDVSPPRLPDPPRPPGGKISPRPPSDKSPLPPGGRGGYGDGFFPGSGDGRPHDSWRPPKTGRVSYRAWDGYYPPWRNDWAPRYRHYYYRSWPSYYIYGGWGTGWYDPWWWGNYWWPDYRSVEVHHYYHYYDDPAYEPYEGGGTWVDAELQTTLTDIAVAWTTGKVELLQAHLTPGSPVSIRHGLEDQEQWVLAPPVLLDLMVEAMDGQAESQFRFVQTEQMEPGLVWAVAEHTFRLRDDEGERSATMEFMFRRHDDTWLVEAIAVSPTNYWWADPKVLDDAARESARLFEEMDRARVQESD